MKELNLLEQVNIENIYKTILDLEGPKYTFDNLEELNEAADYILKKLRSYGIEAKEQEFYLEGFEKPFRNIVGYIGDQSKPAIVIGSHYDTVKDCPGANDNLSAVAVSLEVARVLAKLENPPTVIIAAFTLEEGDPRIIKFKTQKLYEKGIIDDLGRYTSARLLKFIKTLNSQIIEKKKQSKKTLFEILKNILEESKTSLNNKEIEIFNIELEFNEKYVDESPNGKSTYCVGSHKFVKLIKELEMKISYIINLDTLGWIYNKKGSQKPLPLGKEIEPFLRLHKVDLNDTIGNFLGVMGEKNSAPILDEFLKHCKIYDIPFFGLSMPLSYPEIRMFSPDTLRSDHSSFWKEGIPGIFISDTANFRSEHYHTGGDRYHRIDYDMLVKITKATIMTLLSFEY